MARRPSRHPTELELVILKVLWRSGPLQASQVRQALAEADAPPGEGRDLALTSVLTVLNIMVGKKYLRRARKGKAYVYEARVAEGDVTRGMLSDLVRRVFGGSTVAAAANLLEAADLDEEEMKELRELIERRTGEQRQ